MSKIPQKPSDHPVAYEVRIRGHLDSRWAAHLGVSDLVNEADGITLIRSFAADQAALHGLIQRLRDLGLPLVSVGRIDPDQQT